MKSLLLILALAATAEARNVVLVTIDGVRWREFMENAPDPQLSTGTAAVFPNLWRRDKESAILGDDSLGSSMRISNLVALSLPGYQSLMAGGMTRCLSNSCGRIKTGTLVERLAADLGLAPKDLVVVSGWSGVPLAVERSTGTATIDAPASGSRADADTWAAAKKALAGYPRFLWIAFNDPDDFAHAGDYEGYVGAARLCDAFLEELFLALDAAGERGRDTAVLVTTDHGRGDGPDFTSHGGRAEAHRIWLYARGAGIRRVGRLGTGDVGAHANVRPTIEKLLGLSPSGTVLPILVP